MVSFNITTLLITLCFFFSTTLLIIQLHPKDLTLAENKWNGKNMLN